MIRIICLCIATVVALLLFIMMAKGKKYKETLSYIDEKDYPGSEFFGIGMAWENGIPALGFGGMLSNRIREDVILLHGEKYCEFYIRVILAQVYTYMHLCICFFSLLAGFLDSASAVSILLLGVVMGIALGKYYLEEPSRKVKKRASDSVEEFPNMVTKLALMISSGMILREAWITAANSTEGTLHELMLESCEQMQNGVSDIDAIHKFGVMSGSKEMKKFATELIQGIEKGSSELTGILMQQSDELWELKKQNMLQKGEAAATKLIIPTTIMFAGLILVILSTALGGMSI